MELITRFELVTSSLPRMHSTLLSYISKENDGFAVVVSGDPMGLEPTASSDRLAPNQLSYRAEYVSF